ncbi:conserved hypothetical protein [Acidimicrobium ferrooxidans DSM 10331]|uniref:Uncharacterized protein n=1 Tax=Acidimicrobium ferrooxidans (strain DSM 10331 / JCM 15462 / NBRC 103882 / ICP) TaxID=525909 RepID=C7M2K4_ACIFD|nr:hypothetical protein [Acidimicrobium ferrooxidans]ACU53248.1 conserved hypothetical protein [Acidimicrobium ferrooxidans DSM 10331]
MRRRVFDVLTSAVGLAMVVVLLVAGSLLMWGSSFASSQVHNQLAQQQIYFPPAAAFRHAKPGTEITPSMIPSVSQYAGQQLLTGQQAEVYANDFIAVHLSEMPYHGVYAKISAAAMAQPKNAELQALRLTSFEGTTLRGLLLEAYAFSIFGEIAFWASVAAFALAAVMAVLVGLGFWHAGRVPLDKEILVDSNSERQVHTMA